MNSYMDAWLGGLVAGFPPRKSGILCSAKSSLRKGVNVPSKPWSQLVGIYSSQFWVSLPYKQRAFIIYDNDVTLSLT